MKWLVVFGLQIVLCIISSSFSEEQEFIKKPREKKFYPSCQHYTELNADIVDFTNQVIKCLIVLQRDAITEINDYVIGNKACFINTADKKQRADEYAKKMKIKVRLQELISEFGLII